MLTMTRRAANNWREPTRSLPLHWGTYSGRYLGGLLLIVAGGVDLQGSNSNFGWVLAFGTAAHAVGWWIMPAAGWRRIWVVLPGIACIWLLLTGPAAVFLLLLPYSGWLLVRHRPLISWLTLLPVAAASIIVAQAIHEYSGMLVALGAMFAVLVASAWCARWIASRSHVLRAT
jgi:hypothetical protein